jgi:FtsZ-interacting cell division protein YlmF
MSKRELPTKNIVKREISKLKDKHLYDVTEIDIIYPADYKESQKIVDLSMGERPGLILRYCASKLTIPKLAIESNEMFGPDKTEFSNMTLNDKTGLPFGYFYWIEPKYEVHFTHRKIENDVIRGTSGGNPCIGHYYNIKHFKEYYSDEEFPGDKVIDDKGSLTLSDFYSDGDFEEEVINLRPEEYDSSGEFSDREEKTIEQYEQEEEEYQEERREERVRRRKERMLMRKKHKYRNIPLSDSEEEY